MICKHCGVKIHYHDYGGGISGNWADSVKSKVNENGTAMCPNGVKKLSMNPKGYRHEPEEKEDVVKRLLNEIDECLSLRE